MSLPSHDTTARLHQCPFCGHVVELGRDRCLNCREALPTVSATARPPAERHGKIRRGLLYMLLGAVIFYFSGGYSALEPPVSISPVVGFFLSPLIFLNGLAFVAQEYYRNNWA